MIHFVHVFIIYFYLFIYLFMYQITYNLRLIQGKQSSVTASLEHSLDALKVKN